MNGDELLTLTPDEAQALHDARKAAGGLGEHFGGCWCCCDDCDFGFEIVMAQVSDDDERWSDQPDQVSR